jgi:NitT/TauT family transport system ATP-binding protein
MISIKNIKKIFHSSNRNQPVVVFDDFSCEFEQGTITAILGTSGSGKSTLGRIISGLENDYSGTVTIGNKNLVDYLKEQRIGVVPQKYANFEWMNVYENITLDKNDKEYADIIIKKLGLEEYVNFYPRELSGGLQQRVAVARALFHKSEIIIFDEPFGGLDEDTRMKVLEFVQPILEELKITGIFITHKIEEALYIADRAVVFSQKPVSLINDIQVPAIVRNRDFYFNNSVLELKKELLKSLIK